MNQNNTVAQNGQITTNTGEIILYQPDNSIRLEVRMEEETVWLTQAQMAMLFGTQRAAITKHLNNIYQSGEIDMETTCSKMEHVGQNGSRLYTTKYYNLDAILSVGYRVNSKNATTFRRWATHVLKDYLLRGFSINQRVQIMEERIDRQLLDHSVLLMLSKRAEGVTVEIVTRRISETLTLDIERHNRQYPPISVRECDRFHDRFLIIDDTVYHLGASLKDLGKSFSRSAGWKLTRRKYFNRKTIIYHHDPNPHHCHLASSDTPWRRRRNHDVTEWRRESGNCCPNGYGSATCTCCCGRCSSAGQTSSQTAPPAATDT